MILSIILKCKFTLLLYLSVHHYWQHVVIESAVKERLHIVCTDDYDWQCHSVIADFMMNYEKQMLIMNVKINQHCTICQMSFYT